MTDGVHVRLMCTRGVKSTPYQDPRVTVGPATIVIIAEHKLPTPATVEQGLALFTTHVRRATPDTLDPKLNAHSKLNDILACIQAYQAGADEALMLDPHGFVATCNSTHFFIVKGTPDEPEVWTSDGRFCLGGITRGNVLAMCRGSRHHGAREDVQPHRRLQRAGGVRHRDVRGRRAGAVDRRPDHRVGRARSGRDPTAGAVRRLGGRRRRGPESAMTVRVAMWSGPRNISTAMMRAWENRPDTVVVDEPLYAAYLSRTGLDHPGRDEVIASQPTSLVDAVALLHAPLPAGVTVHYAKHMAHHLDPAEDAGWTEAFRNVQLIRDPAEVVASYVRSREACEPDDIGLLQQEWLMSRWDAAGLDVPVIDAADFLQDPESHLRWLCDWLGIDFTDRMLAWPPGPRDVRRRLGAALVRRRDRVDGLRGVPAARGGPVAPRCRGRRGLPPGVRRAPRAAGADVVPTTVGCASRY